MSATSPMAKLYRLIENWEQTSQRGKVLKSVGALLASGTVDVNATHDDDQWKALHYAASQGAASLCELLLEHGADPNDFHGGSTPLHEAVDYGWPEACRALMRGGADPSYMPPNADPAYLTPFQCAVAGPEFEEAQLDLISLLVTECQVDLNQRTRDGRSLMDLAGEKPEVQQLLRALAVEQAVSTGVESGLESGVAPERMKSPGISPI